MESLEWPKHAARLDVQLNAQYILLHMDNLRVEFVATLNARSTAGLPYRQLNIRQRHIFDQSAVCSTRHTNACFH